MIINSTRLRNDYNHVSALCHESGEPVYVTKNGEGDTVLMSVSAYEIMVERTTLALGILEAERRRLAGEPGYTLSDVAGEMKKIVDACAVSR